MSSAAVPAAFNWLSAVWIPLGAAAFGGLLSAAGAVIAIAWQGRDQRHSRDRAAVDLFSHLLKEQARYLTRIGEYRAGQSGQFSFIDADKMQGVFQAFERNREWLVWIKDDALRGRIADQISDNNIWVSIARNVSSEQQQASALLSNEASHSADWQLAKLRQEQAISTINQLFSDLTRNRDTTKNLVMELDRKAK